MARTLIMAFAAACLSAIRPSSCRAATPDTTYSLAELLESAMRRHAEIAEGEFKVKEADAVRQKARAAYLLPRLRLEGESGLVPDAEGDIHHPPSDTTGLRSLGPFARLQLEFAQPIYTFGQLHNQRAAAQAGVAVERAALAGTRVDLALRVKKRYYAVLLAEELQALIDEVEEEIDDKLTEVDEERVLSLADLYSLRLALLTLDTQRDNVARQLELGRSALAWEVGLPPDRPLALAEKRLSPVEVKVPDLPQLVEKAFSLRPDWRRLQAGIAARKAQEEVARSAYWPQIYLAGGIRYAVAPGRTDQHNPFVVDNFNYLNAGAYIGVRQSFEWGLLGADLSEARARHRALRAKESGATDGLRLDVQRAHTGYLEARAQLESGRKARRISRQWLQEALDEYAFDPQTLDDLVDAFETYAKLEQDYQQAVHDYNIAIAELAKTVGMITFESVP